MSTFTPVSSDLTMKVKVQALAISIPHVCHQSSPPSSSQRQDDSRRLLPYPVVLRLLQESIVASENFWKIKNKNL